MLQEELIEKTDKAIQELVYAKYDLQKAYNYYNGIRDADQFRYLEEVYGINNPTTLHFTPLIKKHVDALIGEYLGTPILPKVFCKDSETINNIDREKQLKIAQEMQSYLNSHIKNSILDIISGKKNTSDSLIAQQLKKIIEDINNTFVSEYEIAAQNVVDYIMQSRETDIVTILRDLLLDLLITGYAFYKVSKSESGSNVRIEVCNPLNTFIDRNFNSPYIKNSYRAVYRKWMSRDQILSIYGKEMSREDIKILKEKWDSIYDTAMYYIRSQAPSNLPSTDGLMAGIEVTPGYPNDIRYGKYHELIPVYEVQWTETDKDFKMQRYVTTRIGEEIYILKGKDEEAIRSKSNPNYCSISINGIYFLNRGIKPYSMVLACAHLQDQYDLLNFYRDNLIANSGTIGDWVDLTLIPAEFGRTIPERLIKWLSYKKQGLGVLNSSQESDMQGTPPNTIFNGYDNTVKVQAVQAIQMAIDAIEQTCSSITGVFRERLNGIEQRDAVTNVKIGQNNSFIITKQYYHQMDLLVNEMLLDCLNEAKIVFSKGLTGTIVLGDKYQKVFTALPKYFTLTDHDVRIETSTDVIKDQEQLKQLIPELVKAGQISPDLIIEAITNKSTTDIKRKIKKAIEKQKQENDQVQQLAKQVEELQNQLKQAESELQKSQKKVESLNEEKLKLEKSEIDTKYKIEWYKAQTDRTYKDKQAEEDKRRTDIELQQLYDGNPYNDKVRQLGS